jgi:hypothetical protein
MTRLGASHMRVLGGLGGVVACVGAGVAVAASPKPNGAPLTPPVDPAASLQRSTPSATASPTPCASSPASAGASVDPAVSAALRSIAAAPTKAERQAILRSLTADQRQQVTALLRSRTQPTAGATPAAQAACGQAPMIQPEVIAAAPSTTPVTNSYVS